MSYDEITLNRIYDRTDGRCHLCRKKLSLCNYGVLGNKGAWEVDHSFARIRGGTNHLNNLKPACIPCNRAKRDNTTRAARSRHGYRSAPLSKSAKVTARRKNTLGGVLIGGLLGTILGPAGVVMGATIGGKLGHDKNPDPQ